MAPAESGSALVLIPSSDRHPVVASVLENPGHD